MRGEENAEQAAGLAAAEKVIAEYLPDSAAGREKTPIPEWAERVIAEHIPDAKGKPWGKSDRGLDEEGQGKTTASCSKLPACSDERPRSGKSRRRTRPSP